MKKVLGFKPEYYNRNGMICIDARLDDRDGTVTLVMKDRTFREYGVWVGCNPQRGDTPYPNLTRFFATKSAAMKYARTHGAQS